ncbi:hypothetical protein [Streptomyces sp. NPDC051183]|uniref:hypothetical protein n=1 Tax=Streptomyces sp. NPDC051183 TaxID=3155165 RepID=UPI00341A3DEE
MGVDGVWEDSRLGRALRKAVPLVGEAAGRLSVEYEELRGYQNLVDEMIVQMEGSAAAAAGHDELPKEVLGQGFAEADVLFAASSRTVGVLKKLSQVLSKQLMALSFAVVFSKKGYESMDEETRARFTAIARELRESSAGLPASERRGLGALLGTQGGEG